LKAIEAGFDALLSLGYSIPFDEAKAAQLAEELSPQISRDRDVIAVRHPLNLVSYRQSWRSLPVAVDKAAIRAHEIFSSLVLSMIAYTV